MMWRKLIRKHRQILVPQSNSGRHIDFIEFMLCFMSVLLLTCGLILIGISLWSIIRKYPYYILLNIKVDVPYFALPAGILCCSSYWIATSLHSNRENYRFLHLLILLLCVSLLLLITGIGMGMMSVSPRDTLGSELKYLEWVNFNITLQNALTKYKSDPIYKTAWNRVHHQLRCCGLNTVKDWKNLGEPIPISCCPNEKKTCSLQNIYFKGCLNLIKHDLIWQKNFLVIHCYTIGIFQGFILVVTGALYYWNKTST